MRCIIQRVNHASVLITENEKKSILKGLLIYLAILDSDTLNTIRRMALKIVEMRIFPDENGKMNESLIQKKYSCLLISQFTLYADCKKGNRPYYGTVAKSEHATQMVTLFENELQKFCPCIGGEFGAFMRIQSENSGPVTIILDSEYI